MVGESHNCKQVHQVTEAACGVPEGEKYRDGDALQL